MKEGAEWLWNASRGYRSPILAGILAGTVRIGVSLTFVWFCKHLIDTATHQADGNIILGLAAMAGCIVLQLLLSALVSRLYAHTEISLRNRLRQDLLEHILKSRWNGRETFHSGDMLNRMEEEGLIVRLPDSRDNRQTIITPTQFGIQFVQEHRTGLVDAMAKALELLGPEDAQNYLRIQKKILQNLKKKNRQKRKRKKRKRKKKHVRRLLQKTREAILPCSLEKLLEHWKKVKKKLFI